MLGERDCVVRMLWERSSVGTYEPECRHHTRNCRRPNSTRSRRNQQGNPACCTPAIGMPGNRLPYQHSAW